VYNFISISRLKGILIQRLQGRGRRRIGDVIVDVTGGGMTFSGDIAEMTVRGTRGYRAREIT